MRHRTWSTIAVITFAAASGSCGDDATALLDVASVVITPDMATLAVLGRTVQLTATALDASGQAVPGEIFVWSSSDAGVATVTETGLVTAAANGSVTITAHADGIDGLAEITVSIPEPRISDGFVWVGVFGVDRPFSDAELQTMVDRYESVVIAGFHCLGRRACHADEARRLKALDPDIKVFPYLNGFIREFPDSATLELIGQETWSDEWWLRHQDTGDTILVAGGRGGFVDQRIHDLHTWMIEVILGWLDEGPFDGIAFDRLQGVPSAGVWLERLGAGGVDDLNAGIVELVREVKEALGPERVVIYNGFKDASSSFDGRMQTAPLAYADGVANEYFCHHKDEGFDVRPGTSLEDIIIRDVNAHADAAAAGKLVLAHVSYADHALPQEDKDHINRVCYGSFLLGHRPGFSFYKFGFLNTDELLNEEAPEQWLDFGDPSESMRELGSSVYARDFANGTVVVNLSATEAMYTTPFEAGLMTGTVETSVIAAGGTVSVPALDGVFLMRR